MKDNFELLFDLIPHHPGLNIALIEDGSYKCSDKLIDFCKNINASLYIKNPNSENYEENISLHVEKFDFTQDKYNRHSLQYDFLFICVKMQNISNINFRKIYRAIKNAAQIYMITDKNEKEKFSNILESVNFVAINNIELNEKQDIISAKKMHGWTKV